MGVFKDLKGNKYGRLTVIEATQERKRGAVVWKCYCECGNDVFVARNNLEQGNTLSCGCLHAENLSKRNKSLKTKDITGLKFGRLTAVKPTDQRLGSFVIWECICNCGNSAFATSHNLITGNTTSCGCRKIENSQLVAQKYFPLAKEQNYVEGTRLDFAFSNKPNKNNQTGHRGVYRRKKDGKYTSHLGFQGKKYFLGSYSTIKEAIAIREIAKEKIHGGFLKWYSTEIKRRNENGQ